MRVSSIRAGMEQARVFGVKSRSQWRVSRRRVIHYLFPALDKFYLHERNNFHPTRKKHMSGK